MKTISLKQAKQKLSAVIKDVEENCAQFTITKRGVSKAVILGSHQYEGFMETLEILSCTEEREAIARAKEQINKQKIVTLSSLKKKYGLTRTKNKV
ncbi:MAG: type II toxin-antitoxin system Phd/YefM family antitoxin [Proteobacteria bacterium]|nr:type II toxin-antitoxin system Phd/YefM family antitoxin [Pseudomonadota bacterium]